MLFADPIGTGIGGCLLDGQVFHGFNNSEVGYLRLLPDGAFKGASTTALGSMWRRAMAIFRPVEWSPVFSSEGGEGIRSVWRVDRMVAYLGKD